MYSGGTSCVFNACYASGNGSAGYYLSIVYSTFNGCASDSNGYGYYIYGSSRSLTFNGCGAESNDAKSAPTNGVGFEIYGGKSITLNSCYVAQSATIGFWMTDAAYDINLLNCLETNPKTGATASFQVDSGCYGIHFSQLNYATATNITAGTTSMLN